MTTVPSFGFHLYIRFPNVQGDVVGGKFDRCFKLDSFQWGIGRGISGPSRRRRGARAQGNAQEEQPREVSAPSVSEITTTFPWNAETNFLFGVQMAGVCFPVVEILSDDMTFALYDCIVSGFSVSASASGKSRKSRSEDGSQSASVSLNFTALSQKTTSTFRRPILVPTGLSTGLNQLHEDFRVFGPLVFVYLNQYDLFQAAKCCKTFLHSANHQSLLKQLTHEWGYNISDSTSTMDGFKLPNYTKSGEYGSDDDDNDAASSAEKEAKKAKEELEQQIIREDLQKAPFAYLFLKQ